jgi:copper chaperone
MTEFPDITGGPFGGGQAMEKNRVKLSITGMTCGHCVAAVKKALKAVPGVEEAEVTLAPPCAVVTCDPSRTTGEMLTKATAEEGYPSAPTAG